MAPPRQPTTPKLGTQPVSAQYSISQLKQRALFVLENLQKRYPVRETHLVFQNPWELLVATILSAQCTDARVNIVTPVLFGRWPGPAELAEAPLIEVEKVIRSTGFYHNKAKNIVAAAQRIMTQYGGDVPQTMQELVTLPGVARKTANVVLWGAFGKNYGLAVDTHVSRIAERLGLTEDRDPVRTEKRLMEFFPQEWWGDVNHMMVWFGRHVCIARAPKCMECELYPQCERKGLDDPRARGD